MRHVWAVALAAMLFCSCSNLFHHEIDPVDPSPIVSGIIPTDNQDNVSRNTGILVGFSSQMNLMTITGETIIVKKITVTGSGENIIIVEEKINGSVNSVNTNIGLAIFTLPNGTSFDPQQKYTVTIKRGIQAASGKILEDDFVSAFITGGSVDAVSPVLVSVTPEHLANLDNNIQNFDLRLYFSEPINPEYLKETIITLKLVEPDSEFDVKEFTIADISIDPSKPGSICIKAAFDKGLNPPAEYRVALRPLSSIKDLSGNELISIGDFFIRHLTSYRHPIESPCWLSGDVTECSR